MRRALLWGALLAAVLLCLMVLPFVWLLALYNFVRLSNDPSLHDLLLLLIVDMAAIAMIWAIFSSVGTIAATLLGRASPSVPLGLVWILGLAILAWSAVLHATWGPAVRVRLFGADEIVPLGNGGLFTLLPAFLFATALAGLLIARKAVR